MVPESESRSAKLHPFWWTAMMQGLPDLVTVIDEDGYLAYVSESSARLLGWPARQLVGRRACEFIAPEDRRNSATWLAHVRAYGEVPGLVHRVVLSDGSYGDFETFVRPLSPADRAGHVVAVSRDVAARAYVDHQLDSMLSLLREANDIVTQGVAVVTDSGLILSVNRAAEHLMGLPREQLVGSDIGHHLGIAFPAGRLTAQPSRVVRLPVKTPEIRPEGCADARVRVRVVPLGHHAGLAACYGILLDEIAEAEPDDRRTRAEERTSAALRATLSPRELSVLRLLADGLDVRAISTELRISIHTARYYVKSILRKLDVRTQAQAVAVALRVGLPDIS